MTRMKRIIFRGESFHPCRSVSYHLSKIIGLARTRGSARRRARESADVGFRPRLPARRVRLFPKDGVIRRQTSLPSSLFCRGFRRSVRHRIGVRLHSAGRGIRQAGCPTPPESFRSPCHHYCWRWHKNSRRFIEIMLALLQRSHRCRGSFSRGSLAAPRVYRPDVKPRFHKR